jgi:FG-GAP-like repeat
MLEVLCTMLTLAFACTPERIGGAFLDATDDALPVKDPAIHSMAAEAFDAEGDGDLDIAIAVEYDANRLLINDGTGHFADGSYLFPDHPPGDHEDVAVADYDADGDLDLVFYGEDDKVAAYFLREGERYIDATDRLPARGIANAVVAADIDKDGDPDLVVGNNGPDFVLINDGTGNFTDESHRLPVSNDVTQDIAVGDVNGDGSLDLLFGNEDGNMLYLNDGTGTFTAGLLPMRARPEETRDADLVDVDGDGDLDIYFANVEIFVPDRDMQDRLLLNDGRGNFLDVTGSHLPRDTEVTMSAAFIDFDGDGDLDLLRGRFDLEHTTNPVDAIFAVMNEGNGEFDEGGAKGAIPIVSDANAFDLEVADFTGDGIDDVFVASRGGADRLLVGLPH